MIEITPAFQKYFEHMGWTTYGAVMRHFTGGSLPRANRTYISEHQLNLTPQTPPGNAESDMDAAVDVFYKHYQSKVPQWKFIGRPSKARCEFRNYHVFQQLNLPTAQPVACGEDRDALGRLRGAFIITRAIPDAITLRELFEQQPDYLDGSARRDLLRQLANAARELHQAGFCHNDMFWRNLLVTRPSPQSVKVWWIDCPRGRRVHWPFSTRRKQIKDLASLDKSAFLFCRQTERLQFLLQYLKKTRLDTDAKSRIKSITTFGRNRWPDDWIKPPGVSP